VTGLSANLHAAVLKFMSIPAKHKWEPPTTKWVLPNQRSPWKLQCPLVLTSPSDKSIKMQTSSMVASVTTTLVSREHHNSESTNQNSAESASDCQCSSGQLLWQELRWPPGSTITSTG
jgi:hypothetical protein